MRSVGRAVRTLIALGAWAPVLVFAVHLVLAGVFDAYHRWHPIDIPMHLTGGMAIAFFISRSVRALLASIDRRILAPLEMVLVVSLTASAAVCWEFMEFGFDRVTGSNVQPGLANTIQDMALGIVGAFVVVAFRMRQLTNERHVSHQSSIERLHGRDDRRPSLP